MAGEHHPDCTAQEALDRLKQGNERFVGGTARFPTVQKEVLAEGQARTAEGEMTLVGAVYDLDTGRVLFLD